MRRTAVNNPILYKRFGTYQHESSHSSLRPTAAQWETTLRRSHDLLLTTKRVTSSDTNISLTSSISSGIESIFNALKNPHLPDFLPTVNYLCDTFKHGLQLRFHF